MDKSQIFKDYILLDQIGSGGMGEVYLAIKNSERNILKLVTIKKVKANVKNISSTEDTILTEARILSELNHPNIVSIYDFGENKDEIYLVMEFIEGPTLQNLIDEAKRTNQIFSPLFVAEIGRQFALGLDYIHNFKGLRDNRHLNLVHRDISPQNLMINFLGTCKILDFGISKSNYQLEHTESGFFKGKVGYFSPEQLRFETIDPRTDIYLLGICLWEALTLQRLFKGTNRDETIKLNMQGVAPEIEEFRDGMPPVLVKIIKKCLSFKKEDRYQSAHDLLSELNFFISKTKTDTNQKFTENYLTKNFTELKQNFITKIQEKIQDHFLSRRNKNATDRKVLFLGSHQIDEEKLAQESLFNLKNFSDGENFPELSDVNHIANLDDDTPNASSKTDDLVIFEQESLEPWETNQSNKQESIEADFRSFLYQKETSKNKKMFNFSKVILLIFFLTLASIFLKNGFNIENLKTRSVASHDLTKVVLTSLPEGAEIIQGSKVIGKTPLMIKLPQNSSYSFMLYKKGFHQQSIIFSTGKKTELKINHIFERAE